MKVKFFITIAVFFIGTFESLSQINRSGHQTGDQCEDYCSPGVEGTTPGSGVEMGMEVLPDVAFEGKSGNYQDIERISKFYTKVRVPIFLKEDFKLLTAFNYSEKAMQINDFNDRVASPKLDDRDLKTTGFSLYGIKSLDEKHYLGGKASVNFHGDYEGLASTERNRMNVSLSLLYGIKPSSTTEYGFGITQSYWNQEYSILPVFRYNYTLGDFGIEALLPAKAFARYNFSKTSVIYAGAKYHGTNYLINSNVFNQSDRSFVYDNNAVRFQTEFEQRIFRWVWINFKGGYQKSVSFDLESQQGETLSSDQTGSIYGGIEISIRPSQDF